MCSISSMFELPAQCSLGSSGKAGPDRRLVGSPEPPWKTDVPGKGLLWGTDTVQAKP